MPCAHSCHIRLDESKPLLGPNQAMCLSRLNVVMGAWKSFSFFFNCASTVALECTCEQQVHIQPTNRNALFVCASYTIDPYRLELALTNSSPLDLYYHYLLDSNSFLFLETCAKSQVTHVFICFINIKIWLTIKKQKI